MPEKVVIGSAELWHGDCREVLPLLPRFAAVVTDPPYGLGDLLNWNPGTKSRWSKNYSQGGEWDRATVADGVEAAIAQTDKAVVWGGQFYLLQPARCLLTWNKIIRNWSSSEAEHAWTNLDKPNRVFDYSHGQLATEGKHYHPTQKPVPLMAWCLDQAGRPATVLDPFMGSGSTGVACVQLGLAFTGIERERGYFDAAVDGIAYERANRIVFQSPISDAEKVFRAVFERVTVVDSAVVAQATTRALEDTYADSDVITLYTPGTWVPTGSTITKGAILVALLSWAHQLRLAADAE